MSKARDSMAGYTISLRKDEVDAWAIFSGKSSAPGPWVVISDKRILKNIEDLGEL